MCQSTTCRNMDVSWARLNVSEISYEPTWSTCTAWALSLYSNEGCLLVTVLARFLLCLFLDSLAFSFPLGGFRCTHLHHSDLFSGVQGDWMLEKWARGFWGSLQSCFLLFLLEFSLCPWIFVQLLMAPCVYCSLHHVGQVHMNTPKASQLRHLSQK